MSVADDVKENFKDELQDSNLHLVSYDLVGEEKDYSKLFNKLEQLKAERF